MSTHGKTTTATWNGQSLGSITAIGDVNMSRDTSEDTKYGATDDFKTFLLGYKDTDGISITCNFDAADTDGQMAFAADFAAGTSRTLVIANTAAALSWSLPCLPTGLGTAQPKDNAISLTIKVKPTGVPTLAITSVVGMSACGFSNDVLMMPTFAIGTYEYVVTITNGQTSTVVTPVGATSGEVITITSGGVSQVVATGVASSAIPVSASAMTDIVIVISKTNCAPKTYTFHCAVLAS